MSYMYTYSPEEPKMWALRDQECAGFLGRRNELPEGGYPAVRG